MLLPTRELLGDMGDVLKRVEASFANGSLTGGVPQLVPLLRQLSQAPRGAHRGVPLLLVISMGFVLEGRAGEAAELLLTDELHEQAAPLYEALRARSQGIEGELAYLAPEIRAPAELLLKAFDEGAHPQEAKSSTPGKRKPSAARRRK